MKLFVKKETIKFSAAHMTVFPDGTKEALHGHNYFPELVVELQSTDGELANLVPFAALKNAMRAVCLDWDEKVLLPKNCPFLKIKSDRNSKDREVEFVLCQKRYILPVDEVAWVSVENITVEVLAREFCLRVVERLRPDIELGKKPRSGSRRKDILSNSILHKIKEIEVKIEETPGQGGSFTWKADSEKAKTDRKTTKIN